MLRLDSSNFATSIYLSKIKKFVTVILAMSAIINPTEAEQVVVNPTNSSGLSETPVLDYNLATQ